MTDAPSLDLSFGDNAAERRYEAHLGGQLVAISEYRPVRGRVIFHHTETMPGHEGRGIAARLVDFELGDLRTRGLKITPLCPYVAAYLKRHPEWNDLVDWGPHARP